MNTEKNSLRARAAHLFAAEQRGQDLMSLALLQQHTDNQTVNGTAKLTSDNLEDLIRDSNQNILNIHQQLQNARSHAAHLQGKDAQLNALNQQVYGGSISPVIDDDIIEGVVLNPQKVTLLTSIMTTYLINAPILPNYGSYQFSPLSVDQAKTLLSGEFISAIGHESTAKRLSQLLNHDIAVNRIQISLQVGDVAIIFRLTQRLPEGKVLNEDELFAAPFELGLLNRLA